MGNFGGHDPKFPENIHGNEDIGPQVRGRTAWPLLIFGIADEYLLKCILSGISLAARELIVNPYQAKNKHQRWVIENNYIVSRDYPDNVLGYDTKESAKPGVKVFIQDADKGESQKWIVEHV